MIELIFLFIFIISFGGILFILARKIPTLIELPENGSHGLSKGKYIIKAEDKIKDICSFFSMQKIMHKFLSWVKIMTLKIETKIDSHLHRIRKKVQSTAKNLKEKE